MLSHEKLEAEARQKYTKRLREVMKQEKPNLTEVAFLKGIIKRIDEGKLFN